MKKTFSLILAGLFLAVLMALPQAEIVSRGIIKTTQAWADGYSNNPNYPDPSQTDIDLMENF